MRKEISPEMYNYNKYPGPTFITFDHIVKSDEIQFTLIENYKDAFDAEVFGQRFSEILLKYDYIVGDWGNEQLRLKGFYKGEKATDSAVTIGRLEDYIKEYCNFGCAYFVLENESPKVIQFEDEEMPRRRRRRRRKSNGTKGQPEFKMASVDRQKEKKPRRRQVDKDMHENKQHFTIRQKKN